MRPVACPPIRHERRSTKYPPDFYPPSSPRPSRNTTKGGGSDTLSPNKSVPVAGFQSVEGRDVIDGHVQWPSWRGFDLLD